MALRDCKDLDFKPSLEKLDFILKNSSDVCVWLLCNKCIQLFLLSFFLSHFPAVWPNCCCISSVASTFRRETACKDCRRIKRVNGVIEQVFPVSSSTRSEWVSHHRCCWGGTCEINGILQICWAGKRDVFITVFFCLHLRTGLAVSTVNLDNTYKRPNQSYNKV